MDAPELKIPCAKALSFMGNHSAFDFVAPGQKTVDEEITKIEAELQNTLDHLDKLHMQHKECRKCHDPHHPDLGGGMGG